MEYYAPPIGIQVSAGLLAMAGLCAGLQGLTLLALFALELFSKQAVKEHASFWHVLPLIVALLIAAPPSFFASRALYHLRSWARLAGAAIGTLAIAFSFWLIYWMYYTPYAHMSSNDGDGADAIFITPFTLGAGLWLVIYLSLPSTARLFREANSGENGADA